MPRTRLPKLPPLLQRKIYKTGQTRGADDDQIYQNRVSRSSTVLIPYPVWTRHFNLAQAQQTFQKGYIVLISPPDYFEHLQTGGHLDREGLTLGHNALVFYETRDQWIAHNPATLGWQPAQSRLTPLGGNYVARVPATTATDQGARIIRGFETTANKGAGIRVYEYANETTIAQCRLQLEALFWLCEDSSPIATTNLMTAEHAATRSAHILSACQQQDLLDIERLHAARILTTDARPTCPLCLEKISASGFFSRVEQAEGREVLDLTITQINLFHVEELRMGALNHRPYNIGWGHHHCNVVVKDSGIRQTLEWMSDVLQRNYDGGHIPICNRRG